MGCTAYNLQSCRLAWSVCCYRSSWGDARAWVVCTTLFEGKLVTTARRLGDLPLGGVGHGKMGGCGGHEGSESYNGASSELHFDCLVVDCDAVFSWCFI